jgi:ferritin heavy chain
MAAEESRIRMNYSAEVEAEINRQINMELSASYLYLAIGVFFARDDQALHGFAKFFQVGTYRQEEGGSRYVTSLKENSQ